MTAHEYVQTYGVSDSIRAVRAGRRYQNREGSYTYQEVQLITGLEAFGIAVESLAGAVRHVVHEATR